MGNLVLLCGFHHRLVHEGGFRMQLITGRARDTRFRFWRPDGEEVKATPETPPVVSHLPMPWRARADINGRTSMPLHPGGRVDYGLALMGLRG